MASRGRHPAVRWAAIGLVALLVAGLVAGVAASIASSGSEDASTTSSDPSSDGNVADASDPSGTVPRDGDPEFCAAIFAFQDAYRSIVTPDASATPAQVEANWDTFSAAAGQLTETAVDDMGPLVEPVVGAFDRLRQDADAIGYDYASIDDLQSSATIDPTGQIAQAAYAIFTYGSERCPEPTTTATADG